MIEPFEEAYHEMLKDSAFKKDLEANDQSLPSYENICEGMARWVSFYHGWLLGKGKYG